MKSITTLRGLSLAAVLMLMAVQLPAQNKQKQQLPQRILTTAEGTEIWGCLVSTNSGEAAGTFEGIYSFPASGTSATATALCKNASLKANGGYAYKKASYAPYESFLYYVTYGESNGSVSAHYYIYSTDTWTKNSYDEEVSDPGMIALDVDLDKKSGESYGCFFNSAGTGYEWAKLNYATFEDKTTIKSLSKALWAVAIDTLGQAYAIDNDGTLVKVDKSTGNQTTVGATDLKPQYQQSMAFDPNTNRLYWAATLTSGRTGLYEVNTSTGKATLIRQFPNDEEYTALYIPERPKGGVPAVVSNLKADFPNGALEGTVSFTAPMSDVDGNELSADSLSYYIVGEQYYGLDTLRRGKVLPGGNVSEIFTYNISGKETYIVLTRNTAGLSPNATVSAFVGHDTPSAPSNISLTYDKTTQNAVLTWDAPTTGANGGYVVPDEMTYTVVRYPDGATVAEKLSEQSYTELITDTLGKEYYYGVSATYDFKQGAEGVSNHLKFFSPEDTLAAKVPQAPRNVTLTEQDNDVFLLTWNAPANVADSASLTYYIYQGDEEGRLTAVDTLENGIKSWQTTFSDDLEQNYVYYRVGAHNEYGTGPDGRSNIAVYGKPYNLPFHESFAGGGMATWVWSADDGDASFSLTSDAQDGDGGALSANLNSGQTAGMTSPKITLDGTSRPKLTFWTNLKKATLTPVVNAYGHVQSTQETITATDGWVLHTIDLSAFKDSKYIRISFRANATGDSARAIVDNLDVLDVPDNDIAVTSINTPTSVQAGKKVRVLIGIRNLGNRDSAATDYSVQLYADGKEVESSLESPLPALKSMETAIVTLLYDVPATSSADEIILHATLVYANDGNVGNNTSERKGVKITTATLPPATGVTLTTNGGSTTMTWTAPEIGDQLEVTDDFESYEHWTTENFSPWTTIDIDKGKGYDISIDGTELHFPHATEAFAFLSFNADDYNQFSTLKAHSGSQYLAAFSPSTYYSPQADDWLVSPELSGLEQTVSIWARSYLATGDYSYPETFEILYSTTDTSRESFTRADNALFQDISEEWTEYSAELPEGAKYFAVHYISADKFAAFFDDATYSVAAPEVLGYIVCLDGEPVDTLAAGTTTWTVPSGTSTSGTYSIIVMYSTGCSAPAVAVDPTGISSILIQNNTFETDKDSPTYNLAGQRVNSTVWKGIKVRKGRKTIVK